MATGSVGYSGRARKLVAPNSPSEMVKANTPLTSAARAMMGKSTSHHTRQGEAPSTAAACRRLTGIERSAGSKARTTKGSATSECASGINSGSEPESKGGRLNTTMNPNPSVTAEVPSGSINSGSSTALMLAFLASALDARNPNVSENNTVVPAYASELRAASMGGT